MRRRAHAPERPYSACYAPSVLLALRIASTLDRPVEDLFFIDTTKES